MKRGVAIAIVLGLGVVPGSGCEDGASSVTWDLQFETECVRAATARVRVRIRLDGCFGTTVAFEQMIGPDMPELDTPTLDPGRYGLEGEALDASGSVVGRGCIDVHLPLRGDGARVVLAALPGAGACGLVARPDAGPLPFIDGGPTGCTAGECDDMLECTIDSCVGDGVGTPECLHSLSPGWCAIDGACFPNGALNPDDPCFACDTKLASAWWPAPVGTSCGAGGVCDGLGHCE